MYLEKIQNHLEDARALFLMGCVGKMAYSALPPSEEQIDDALFAPTSFWFLAMGPQGSIGLVSLQDFNPIDRTAEIGVSLWPTTRGAGHGLEAAQMIRQWGIDNLNLRKTTQYILEDSPGLHLVHGMGDTLEGTLKAHRYKNGKYLDVLIYSWIRQE